MKSNKIGIVSYNKYSAFTNYGSVLQSWALSKVLQSLGYDAILIDYCPKALLNKDMLNPLKSMKDQDSDSQRNCELSLPAIKENYLKINDFINSKFNKSKDKYNYTNFNETKNIVDAYICGSDTIFCINESEGFDDAFFANYDCMKNKSIAYAASFGDTKITSSQVSILNNRLTNFKAIGLRESRMLNYVTQHCSCPVHITIDPTLLLNKQDYLMITDEKIISEDYLLLYSRRYNSEMEAYAENYARKNGLRIVEISLRALNKNKGHLMFYNAGIEEFLSLIKNANYVVTNSYHGLLFSIQFEKQFAVFLREYGESKINEVVNLLDLNDYIFSGRDVNYCADKIDYNLLKNRISLLQNDSMKFLEDELKLL